MTDADGKPVGLDEVFVGMSRKYNRFFDTGVVDSGRGCKNCVRRQFSFPDTCNDGWPMGSSTWVDRGDACGNWTRRGLEPTPREDLAPSGNS